jgi:hypothetical protein
MGSILINVPDIADGELAFNEAETKQILKYFWPKYSAQVDQMLVTDDTRRLAQTALIAAIDGSNALGFIDATFSAVARPSSGLKALAKKLATNFTKKWWQHTKPKDLQDAKIYDRVRDQVVVALNSIFIPALQGASFGKTGVMFSYTTLCRSIKV